MTDSQQLQTTLSTLPMEGQFPSGSQHPRYTPDYLLVAQMGKLLSSTTRVLTGKTRVSGNRRLRQVEALCLICQKVKWVWVQAIRVGGASCPCQKGKYHDPRAKTLGERYDSMVQRCRRDTHVSSHNYKGRGIQVLFESREHFIRWALAAYPQTDFKGLNFDRINNEGHYEPANMRLVTRSVNLKNRRLRGGDYCKHGHPLSGENLRVAKSGYRVCRACNRRMSREWAKAHPGARRKSTISLTPDPGTDLL